jgi:prophage antirepressor-like protein
MLISQSTEFMGLTLNIIDHNHQRWLTAEQVGLALGYESTKARQGVNNLFKRHEDEFTEQDSTVIKLMTVDNKNREARIFSQSGCNLLSFFANTPRAKQFRTWAKQVLVNIQKDPIERMANSVEKLAEGMDVIVRKLDHTDKYVGMLERNQRGHVKITWEVAEQVKDLYAGGMPQASIARELRISAASVNQIVKGKYVFSERAGVPTQLEQDIQQEKHKLLGDDSIQK